MPSGSDYDRALLDTSVVLDLATLDETALPLESAISAITLAELSAGVGLAPDPVIRAMRMHGLQTAEATFDVLPFDALAARIYGQIDALVRRAGRKPGGRVADLLIAATAVANDLPVITRNAKDLAGLESVVKVVAI